MRSRGKVLLTFEDNSLSKVGVKFDKPITDGVDLGGPCEGGYGFFCNDNFLGNSHHGGLLFTSFSSNQALLDLAFLLFHQQPHPSCCQWTYRRSHADLFMSFFHIFCWR